MRQVEGRSWPTGVFFLWTLVLAVGGTGILVSCQGGGSGGEPEAARTTALAATCASCHGTEGRSVAPEATSLAGLSEDFLLERLERFREDEESTVMHELMKGYTNEEIALVSAYFAAQAPEGDPR